MLTQCLFRLDMYGNYICAHGAARLSDVLLTNTSLVYLDLCFTNLGVQGAGEIAKALLTNTTLEQLNVGSNQIGREGALHIGRALRARPRPRSGSFCLEGIRLCELSAPLGLPTEAAKWGNQRIMHFWWEQQERSLAFYMLTHERLGNGSIWASLEVNILHLILSRTFFCEPGRSCAPESAPQILIV